MKNLLPMIVLALGEFAAAGEPPAYVSPDCPCGPSCDCAPCNCGTLPIQFRRPESKFIQVCDGVTCRLVPVAAVVDPPKMPASMVEVKSTVPLPMAGPGPTTRATDGRTVFGRVRDFVSSHRPHPFARLRAGLAGVCGGGMP